MPAKAMWVSRRMGATNDVQSKLNAAKKKRKGKEVERLMLSEELKTKNRETGEGLPWYAERARLMGLTLPYHECELIKEHAAEELATRQALAAMQAAPATYYDENLGAHVPEGATSSSSRNPPQAQGAMSSPRRIPPRPHAHSLSGNQNQAANRNQHSHCPGSGTG